MKIENIRQVVAPVYYVTTDEEGYFNYRRYEDGQWEIAMGESWEPVYRTNRIEALFQEFLKLWDK